MITSPYSFAASANCFIYEGATPVFADIDPRTLNLDPAAVEAAITPRTKAIVAVDIYGYPCELDELRAIADRHGLALIDDSCEALGAEYKGARLGSHGTSGRLRLLSEQADHDRRGRHGHDALGGGVAPRCARSATRAAATPAAGSSTFASASTTASTTSAPRSGSAAREARRDPRAARARSRSATTSCSRDIDGVELPCADDADHVRSWFVYVVKLPDNATRERVIAHFEREGIGFNRYLPSIHLQPYMRERYGFREGLCPVSEDVSSRYARAAVLHRPRARDAQERVAEVLAAALLNI